MSDTTGNSSSSRAGQIQRHWWTRDVGDAGIQEPLMGKAAQEHTLQNGPAEDPAAGLGTGFVLARGRLGRDQLQPTGRIGLLQRQRHHHRRVLITLGSPRLLVEGDGHHGAQRQPIDRFAAACQ
jgi:hypothetical protein